MEQMELFNELISENKIWDAYIVIKNLFKKECGNKDIFSKFFDFACMVASWNIELSTRKYFINEAEMALSIFTESTFIDREQLEFIKKCRNIIVEIKNSIFQTEEAIMKKQKDEITEKNNILLNELVQLKNKLFNANNQDDFDKYLLMVNEKDKLLIKDSFTEKQKILYDNLTNEYSKLISNKLQELNYLSNINYNNKAVKDFKYVFDEFRTNISKYCSNTYQLRNLVVNHLFSYDITKLFNETLVFYNFVYSYIFEKLDEEGKFELTKFSIESKMVERNGGV